MLQDIYVRLIRVHLLHRAAQAPFFGAEMIAELQRHKYRTGPGTLYPVLHGLEHAGYLKSARRVDGGKVRRYYRITPAGRRVARLLQRRIRDLVEELFRH